MYSKTPSRLIHCVCPITPQSVDATPATAVIIGSNPINGITMKNGTFVIGPNQACLNETVKFISSLE